EDVVQESFMRVLVGIDTYDERRASPSEADAWLYSICRNVAIDRLRALRTYSTLEGLEDAILSDDSDPEVLLENHEEYDALAAALGRLSDDERAELRRSGRRGPRSRAWHLAAGHWLKEFHEDYGKTNG